MRRRLALGTVLVLGAAVAACNGWPRAGEHAAARTQPENYPTYVSAQNEAAPVEFAGHHWIVAPGAEQLVGARLQQVGTAGNVPVYAAPGAQPPYAVLYAPAGSNKWRRVVPID